MPKSLTRSNSRRKPHFRMADPEPFNKPYRFLPLWSQSKTTFQVFNLSPLQWCDQLSFCLPNLRIVESGSCCLFVAGMVEVSKILYLVVVDEGEKKEKGKLKEKEKEKEKESFRYTRPVLQSTLQLMGCKARHAFKVCCLFKFDYHDLVIIQYYVCFQFLWGLFIIVLW